MKKIFLVLSLLFAALIFNGAVLADQKETVSKETRLSKDLKNPVSSLISIPFQNNFYSGLGTTEAGNQYLLRVQPIIPLSFNKDYNLFVRPIFSYISQHNVIGSTSQSGFSDTQIQMFFSPKGQVPSDIVWGIGPLFFLPTAVDSDLGTEKWGIGPSAAIYKQYEYWSVCCLATQIWSVAGNKNRADINQTFLQPIIAYTNKIGTSLSCQSEMTYDWTTSQLTVPLEADIGQVLCLSGQYVSLDLVGIYNLQSPVNISKWSSRLTLTLLLPNG